MSLNAKQKKNGYLQVLAAALDLPKESAILKNKKEKNHKNVHEKSQMQKRHFFSVFTRIQICKQGANITQKRSTGSFGEGSDKQQFFKCK